MVRLLIVEDDDVLALQAQNWLSPMCSYIERTRSGIDSMKRMQRSSFDVVVVGSRLPDMSGGEFCRRVNNSNLFVPVIVISANKSIDEKVDALDAGAQDFIDMPDQLEELPSRMRCLLRRYGKLSLAPLAVPAMNPVAVPFVT
jgi:DNA-binding response OmpR family regulator